MLLTCADAEKPQVRGVLTRPARCWQGAPDHQVERPEGAPHEGAAQEPPVGV